MNTKKTLRHSNNPIYSDNVLMKMSFEFAIHIIQFSEILEENKKFVVARQLIRSGTAAGALVRESQNAESKLDFIHKLKIAAKELDETEYWLLLCDAIESYPSPGELLDQVTSLQKLLNKIISTSKKNLKQSKA
jgi:four helix bundle protein